MYVFEISATGPEQSVSIELRQPSGNRFLKIDLPPYRRALHVEQWVGASPVSSEIFEIVAPDSDESHSLVLRPAADLVEIVVDGHTLATMSCPWLDGPCLLDISGPAALGTPPEWMNGAWRAHAAPSGYPARENGHAEARDLSTGLSFIIRAKNEDHVIEANLASIAPLADEIVFVDNGSSDDTLAIARNMASWFHNISIFEYPKVLPKVGEAHFHEVRRQGDNTLADFYNWCLARSSRFNFIKWDADCIAIAPNLSDMIERFALNTRADNVCVWLSGLTVFTDGDRYWVDTGAEHSEFQVFSRLRGAAWVNLPPWEEMDQSYIYKAHRLFYDRPVYMELVRLDPVEYRDRGLYLNDPGDSDRQALISNFLESGQVPDRFEEIESLTDERLLDFGLTQGDRKWSAAFKGHWQRAPRIINGLGRLFRPDAGSAQHNPCLLVLIPSRPGDTGWRHALRETWLRDAERNGLPFFFVIRSPRPPFGLIGDCLHIDEAAEDSPFCEKGMQRIFKLLGDKADASHFFLVAQESVVNVERLVALASLDTGALDWLDPCTPEGRPFAMLRTRSALQAPLTERLDSNGSTLPPNPSLPPPWARAEAPDETLENRENVLLAGRFSQPAELISGFEFRRGEAGWSVATQQFERHFKVVTDWMDLDEVSRKLAGVD